MAGPIDPRTTFYVPVHADFSQVEQVAAIVGSWPHGRVFLYDFNPKLRAMHEHYVRLNPRLAVSLMSPEALLSGLVVRARRRGTHAGRMHPRMRAARGICIPVCAPRAAFAFPYAQEDAAEGRRVVVLLTATRHYAFGEAQAAFFGHARALLPRVIVDVFHVGHCLYGCLSNCASEHRVPVYFTRFARGAVRPGAAEVAQLCVRPRVSAHTHCRMRAAPMRLMRIRVRTPMRLSHS